MVKREEWRRVIRFFASALCAILIVGIVLLFPSYLTLFLQKRDLERALSLEEGASARLRIAEAVVESRAFQYRLETIKALRDTPSPFSSLWSMFFSGQGAIVVQHLTVEKGGEFSLNGFASTRTDLLNFEKRLRESEMFQDISSPLSNIVRGTNINFVIQGKVVSPQPPQP